MRFSPSLKQSSIYLNDFSEILSKVFLKLKLTSRIFICFFKNLSQEEFDVIWGRLYHSYLDGLTYSEVDIDEATLIDSSY